MKKFIIPICFLLVLGACTNNENRTGESFDSPTMSTPGTDTIGITPDTVNNRYDSVNSMDRYTQIIR